MENLSHLVGAVPPTSQSAGNTTSDNSSAMTAPGSASEGAPQPQRWMGLEIPAQRGPSTLHPEGSPAASPWTSVSGRPWVSASDQTPGGGNRPDSPARQV